jgi:hypothetical protein
MIDIEIYIAQQFYPPEAAAQARRDIAWAIEQVYAENTQLRTALTEICRIAGHGDVNMQPLLHPIIEKAKSAIEK